MRHNGIEMKIVASDPTGHVVAELDDGRHVIYDVVDDTARLIEPPSAVEKVVAGMDAFAGDDTLRRQVEERIEASLGSPV